MVIETNDPVVDQAVTQHLGHQHTDRLTRSIAQRSGKINSTGGSASSQLRVFEGFEALCSLSQKTQPKKLIRCPLTPLCKRGTIPHWANDWIQ